MLRRTIGLSITTEADNRLSGSGTGESSGQDVTMMTTYTENTSRHRTWRKPNAGRPALFVLLLSIAAVGVLGLLIAGPTIALSLSVASALALICLVSLAWAVAGPRL